MPERLKSYLTAPVSAAPLAVFRVIFGGMMLASVLRFMAKGWVTDLYVLPKVYFPYYGFEWVQPLGEADRGAGTAIRGRALAERRSG